jgi:hypothetical protein
MPLELTDRDLALGPCPICGNPKWWFNDVPLAGFCWGPEDHPHRQIKRVLKGDMQPYRKMPKPYFADCIMEHEYRQLINGGMHCRAAQRKVVRIFKDYDEEE